MRKLLKISTCFIVITMVVGCRKDTPDPLVIPTGQNQPSGCHSYTYSGTFISTTFVSSGDQYKEPCFNPNNQDELVYIKQTSGTMQLVKHTISTGQEQVLHEGMYYSPPQWGKQGWILFSVGTHPPLVIWKIYEDGTGLAQVTPSNLNSYAPRFNAAGDKFIEGGEAIKYPYLCIYNLNGDIIDSVRYNYDTIATGFMCPYNDDFKNGYYTYGDLTTSPIVIGIGKLNNGLGIERLSVINFPSDGGGSVEAMCQNSQAIYYVQHWLGLFSFDKTTHQTSLLMENCPSKYINSLSMSPDGQNILYERVRGHQTTPGGWDIDEQSEIFLYNIATGQEIKLLGEE